MAVACSLLNVAADPPSVGFGMGTTNAFASPVREIGAIRGCFPNFPRNSRPNFAQYIGEAPEMTSSITRNQRKLKQQKRNSIMKKQNILALALKPAMRVTESVGIGVVLMLAAALIAMITPSAATAGPPSKTPTATLLVTRPGGYPGQHRRPRWCALRQRKLSRQDLAR